MERTGQRPFGATWAEGVGEGTWTTDGGARLRLRDVPRAVAGAVRADFAAWVERNFFNARAGRIGNVSYARAGELDDAVPESGPRGGRREARRLWYMEAYDRALVDHTEPLNDGEADFLLHHPHIALQLALGVTDLRGLRCLRRGLAHEVDRLQRRACRSRYYARDNARRRALAAERRAVTRRTTVNACPTPEALRAAFAARGASPEAKVRLGGLLEDLECHVDNCLRIGPCGEILGRNGGVKAWLRENTPELFGRYKTLMRYKSLARRLRQAVDVRDPVPVDTLLPPLRAEGPDGSPASSDPSPAAPAPRCPPCPAGGRARPGRCAAPAGREPCADWFPEGHGKGPGRFSVGAPTRSPRSSAPWMPRWSDLGARGRASRSQEGARGRGESAAPARRRIGFGPSSTTGASPCPQHVDGNPA